MHYYLNYSQWNAHSRTMPRQTKQHNTRTHARQCRLLAANANLNQTVKKASYLLEMDFRVVWSRRQPIQCQCIAMHFRFSSNRFRVCAGHAARLMVHYATAISLQFEFSFRSVSIPRRFGVFVLHSLSPITNAICLFIKVYLNFYKNCISSFCNWLMHG